jgi:hypothetical protein
MKSVFKLLIILIILILFVFPACSPDASDGGGGDDDDDDNGPVDTVPPAALVLAGITTNETAITVSWEASSDEDYSHARISVSDSIFTDVYDAEAGTLSGLTGSTEYTITLNAVDTAGNLSDDVSFLMLTTESTAEDLIFISTAEELNNVRAGDFGWYFITADIDLSGYTSGSGWSPIDFNGKMFGNRHVVSSLFIDTTDDYCGLFERIGSSGAVYELGLTDIDVSAGNFSGGFTGENDGSIKYCHVTGTLTIQISGGNSAGGFVGYNTGSIITDCYASVSVNAGDNYSVGGFAGTNDGGIITDCHSSGDVTCTGNHTGGFAGRNMDDSIITYCYSEGNLNGDYGLTDSIGGFTGSNAGTIFESWSSVTVNVQTAYYYVGGFVGTNTEDAYIAFCHAEGTIENGGGGFIGTNTGTISYSYASGTLNDQGGGFAFQNYDTGIIMYCYATGAVTKGSSWSGGFCGMNVGSGTITDCYAMGNVSCSFSLGGFLGLLQDSSVTNCYATGYVDGPGGGLIGGTSGLYSITDSYYDMDTTGQNDTGRGIPVHTEDIKDASTFLNWDFTNIWAIDSAGIINNGYPYLRDNMP